MSEEAKAVQEVAKTTNTAIHAAEKMGKFIATIAGVPMATALGIVDDKLRYIRWERQLKLIDKANAKLAQRGLYRPTRALPLQFAMPLVEAAALEEDDYLQDLWATVLANAADETVEIQLRRAFISILEDMTSLDVQILKVIGAASQNSLYGLSALDRGFYLGYLPERAAGLDDFQKEIPAPKKEVRIAVGNLQRLNVLSTSQTVDGVSDSNHVRITALGEELLRMCSSHGEAEHGGS
ncbi:hypothetical protein MSNKSG1_02349 [Marinobacter santoriniensis NKSG1]|uniref:DUF4393 domain-containing protein n=1 Tax=Marinobacter santoriniensis NKSG1 TaxID=1288826 RepID=M7CVE0_9GAMM|nr:Abi-alpha family protein [Marinobacter santoriniensis]EMP57099.1 hypothetical protein MSNKSG1_02349 [Marinobacter santoriniensis NKSG1]